MKIPVAFLIGSFRRGGAERDLLELLTRMDRNKYDFHILYAEKDGDMLPDFEATGVPMRQLGIDSLWSLAGLRAVRASRAFVRENRIQVLLGFGVYGSFYAAILAGGSPRTALVSYEFTAIEPKSARERFFQPWYYRRSAAIIGNSDAVVAAVAARRGVARGRLHKIYNGVDVARYSSRPRDPAQTLPGVPPGALVVGSVGRLHPIKGHRYLVEAWPAVAARFPGARLVLVGPAWPQQQKEIEETARRAGCAESVILMGLRHDVASLIPMMDVVALPSITEGFSNVLLEAGACGRPTVATRVGGNPETILDGETGLLVPPRDAGAMSEALIRLLSDPSLRARMGEAARYRVTKEFAVDRMVDAWDSLFTRLSTSRPAA